MDGYMMKEAMRRIKKAAHNELNESNKQYHDGLMESITLIEDVMREEQDKMAEYYLITKCNLSDL